MQILLSPAKTMVNKSKIHLDDSTIPHFEKEAKEIAFIMTQYNVEELMKILPISHKIAVESYMRYQEFFSPEPPPLQAILAYTGVVFRHIKPSDFSIEDFEFANERINIVSILYGLLRPFDKIKPYRMEYDVRVPELSEKNLYEFWSKRQTSLLIENIRKDDGILINLGSKDILPSFHLNEVQDKCRIITPEFKVLKNKGYTTVVIYAKMARGEMSRFIIKNRITNPEDLKGFEWEGFHFREDMSDERNWAFIQE